MLASGYLTVIGDQIPAPEPAPGSHGTKVPLWGGPAISRFAPRHSLKVGVPQEGRKAWLIGAAYDFSKVLTPA
jgi:hypothetical protein